MTGWRGTAGTTEQRGAEERVWRAGRRGPKDAGPPGMLAGGGRGAGPRAIGSATWSASMLRDRRKTSWQSGSQADKKSPNQTGVVFPPEG